jgi:hypothetical protein
LGQLVRDHQFSVAIRSGGNSYEGFSSEAEIVIDLTFLALDDTGAQFRLDLASGVVHVASGVRLGVLYTELAKAGVAFAGGQCSPVCAGGLVGTGGVGFSTRTFGYACDQLVEVEYVLADGRVIVASATNQFSDLFFATKGAGAAGLGVMTRLTLTVVSAKTLLFYALTFQLLDAAIVIDKWQNLVAAPAALSSSIVNLTAATPVLGPPTFFVDGEFRVEQGTIQDAKAELELILRTQWLSQLPSPLNQTQIVMEAVSVVEAATIAASQVPMPTLNQWKLKSNFFFNRISAPALQPLVDFLLNNAPANDPTTAVGAITISLHGGMANQIAPRTAVVPARAGTVAWFHGGAFWNQQSLEPQCLEFVNSLFRVAAPILGSQTAFYGCPDRELGTQSPKGSPGSNYNYLKAYWSGPTLNFVPFLLGVKRRYDPQDVFRFAQSIPVNAAL